MELFLLRHGHAETEAPKDSLRELSARGKLEVRDAIESNIDSLSALDQIIVSPYVRAQQSAQVVLSLLDSVSKTDSDLLLPNGDPRALIQYLHGLYHKSDATSILLVGHQPLLGILLDTLVGADPGRYRLATASLAAIDTGLLAIGCCELRWLQHVEK